MLGLPISSISALSPPLLIQCPRFPPTGVDTFVRLGSLINGAWQYEDCVYTESGTAIPATLSPSSGALSTSQTFTWNNGNEAAYYQLKMSTSGPGSPVLLDTGVTMETSATVSIPANAEWVYAVLYQLVDGAWQYKDYTFTAPGTFPNYVVNTVADDSTGTASNCTSSPEGVCTLRDALAAANAVVGSNITFDPAVFLASNSAAANTITISNGKLNIPINTAITGLTSGSGATLTNLVTVSGNNATQIFNVVSGVTGAVIANLNVANGNSSGNGGAITNAGWLTVSGSTFSGNSASGDGGAIFSHSGVLTITGSTFTGNSSVNFGALYSNAGVLTVTGSTFSGNTAYNSGGAIGITNMTGTLKNSTVSANTAGGGSGGGIYVSGGTLAIANSIVESNSLTRHPNAGLSDIALVSSTLNNLGGNLVNTSIREYSVNPNLSPLGNYGGPTQTMLPQPSSAAICGGIAQNIPAGVTTDQRGYPIENTTYPGYSSNTPCADSGAVQTNYALAFTTQPPASTTVGVAIAPVLVVNLTESGKPFSASTGTVRMTDSANALSGLTSEALLSGTGTFDGLELLAPATDDIFTASLGLNPMLNISAQASVGVTAVTSASPLPATMLSPTPGINTILGTGRTLFQWTAGADVTNYELLIGTNGVGTSNILTTAALTTTSYIVPPLPADGVTLFVRLGSLINGAWQNEDYIYTESGTADAATLSPSSGELATTQTFTWNNGNDAIYYQLNLGTTGPGSMDIFGTGVTTETWATVNIPANEATVYATLYQLVGGAWKQTDYTFTGSMPLNNFVVNTATDDATGTASKCTSSPEKTCTLRDALAAAIQAGSGDITFSPSVFLASKSVAANTITLSNGTLNIPPNTTITGLTSGSGATLTNRVTVSGNNATTVFNVASGAGAVLANLNLSEGANANGNGGGISSAGYLTVTGSNFSNNSGGAIYDSGALIVTGSTFSGNSITGYGGAISGNVLTVTASTFSENSAFVGGAISGNVLTVTGSTFSDNSALEGGAITGNVLTVAGSTFSGNSATQGGGAIYNYGGQVLIEYSTITDNSDEWVGGIAIYSGHLYVSNSIVEGNTATSSSDNPDIFLDGGTLKDLGGNLINKSNSPAVVNPNLTPLGNYGGPTQTILPQPGSKAICGGRASNIPAGVTTDQRGYPIENTTYPGYSSATPCVDSGSVQTNYALAFTTQPPKDANFAAAIAPPPVVTLNESGKVALLAAGAVRMTDSSNALSGGASEGLLSGTATFTDLILDRVATDDIFTASLELNPSLKITAQASVGVTTTAPVPPTMRSPKPGIATILGISNVTFTWTPGTLGDNVRSLGGHLLEWVLTMCMPRAKSRPPPPPRLSCRTAWPRIRCMSGCGIWSTEYGGRSTIPTPQPDPWRRC